MSDWATSSFWALDFCRALRERPWWARMAFRWVVGKYAYREFVGIQDSLMRNGYNPFYSYGIEETDYHNDRLPDRWWEERDPMPKETG